VSGATGEVFSKNNAPFRPSESNKKTPSPVSSIEVVHSLAVPLAGRRYVVHMVTECAVATGLLEDAGSTLQWSREQSGDGVGAEEGVCKPTHNRMRRHRLGIFPRLSYKWWAIQTTTAEPLLALKYVPREGPECQDGHSL
jgi:hypothetical protein